MLQSLGQQSDLADMVAQVQGGIVQASPVQSSPVMEKDKKIGIELPVEKSVQSTTSWTVHNLKSSLMQQSAGRLREGLKKKKPLNL